MQVQLQRETKRPSFFDPKFFRNSFLSAALIRLWAIVLLAAGLLFSQWASAQTTAQAGDLVIAEFRVRGPSGANDEYVVVQNITENPHTVTAADGSGYGLAASNGVTRFTIPNGTVIPAGGYYLGAGSNYSLNGAATPNATWSVDIPDNAGIALFNNNLGGADYSMANRLDAVGSTSEANTLYKEGTGYPALTPFSIDYAFYRDLCGHAGSITATTACPSAGDVKDTNNNAADFVFVDTNGTSAGAGQRLGAPSPRNLASPMAKIGAAGVDVRWLDTNKSVRTSPNWQRPLTSDPANNATFGRVAFTRVFTNNTGADITKLRLRVVDLTTFPAPSGYADLRPQTSGDMALCTVLVPCGDDTTSNFSVNGTTLEQPPSQPNGGGFNSTYSVNTVSSATPLANGASVNVRFQAGVQQEGIFKIRLMLEALTSSGAVAGSELIDVLGTTQDGPYLVPSVSAISPAVGLPAGGDVVTITGTGFTSDATVDFGGTAGTSIVIVSETQITVTTPAHGAGEVSVTVTTAGGQSNAQPFTYVTLPTVSSLAPAKGTTVGGTSVVIAGTHLSDVTEVKFGAVDAQSFEIDSATQITAISPAGAAGTVDVTVTTSAGTSATSAASQFTYQFVSASLPTPAGNVVLNLSGAQCEFMEAPAQTVAPSSGVPAGFDFPYGQIAFKANGCDTGGTLNVSLAFPATVDQQATLFKLVDGEWQEWGASITGSNVQFTVIDNDGSSTAQATGDNDPTPGRIDDPVLLAVPKALVPAAVTPVPVFNPWTLMVLSLMLAAFGLTRVRRF